MTLRFKKPIELRIPLSAIASVDFREGWFSCSLLITPGRLAPFGHFPEYRNGAVRLKFAKKQADVARRFAEYLERRVEETLG